MSDFTRISKMDKEEMLAHDTDFQTCRLLEPNNRMRRKADQEGASTYIPSNNGSCPPQKKTLSKIV